jgi:anthranilate phosphoribosyltransferase
MIKEAIAIVAAAGNLDTAQAVGVMQEILGGSATPAQIAAFATAMRMKGETAAELHAFASEMRRHARPMRPHVTGALLDTCGTGGDGAGTFNISTTASIIAAGAGAKVVKHGNRGVTSSCGSADLLERCGVAINTDSERAEENLRKTGFCFLYAPLYHPAMKHAAAARSEIGIRTFFNLLGPLTNPAGADAQLVGVFSPGLCGMIAEVLQMLGTQRALVVHGNGLDEITTAGTGITRVAEVDLGTTRFYDLDCRVFGIEPVDREELQCIGSDENAATFLSVLEGEHGAARDIAALNAGAAIYLSGCASTIAGGLAEAYRSIDSGRAIAVLDTLITGNRRD